MTELLVYTVTTQEPEWVDNVTSDNVFDTDTHKSWLSETPRYTNYDVYASLKAAKTGADRRIGDHSNLIGTGQWKPAGMNGYSAQAGLEAATYIRDVVWLDHVTWEYFTYWQTVDLKAVIS